MACVVVNKQDFIKTYYEFILYPAIPTAPTMLYTTILSYKQRTQTDSFLPLIILSTSLIPPGQKANTDSLFISFRIYHNIYSFIYSSVDAKRNYRVLVRVCVCFFVSCFCTITEKAIYLCTRNLNTSEYIKIHRTGSILGIAGPRSRSWCDCEIFLHLSQYKLSGPIT